MAERVLLFGGTFDPVHHAHLLIARAAAAQLGVGVVWLIPSATPPHKRAAVASGPDRLAMLKLAVADDELFEICDLELRRGGQSYTVDTLAELRKQLPEAELFWLIGADMLADLAKWYQAETLVKSVRFATAVRPPFDTGLEGVFGELAEYFDADVIEQLKADVIDAPVIDVASSDIRRRIAAGGPVDELISPAVADYIGEHHLYK